MEKLSPLNMTTSEIKLELKDLTKLLSKYD